MPGMDIFDSDPFSMVALTARLLDRPHVPRRIGQMGIFESEGITTTDCAVEKRGNTIQLVQTTPRGGPGVQNTDDTRDLLRIPTARIALDDAVNADEVQGVRAFGSETDLEMLEEKVDRKNGRMSDSIAATEEHQRIGALKGKVLDADGSTLLDLFDRFGVAAQSEVAMDFANVAEGDLRTKVNQAIIRPIEDELGDLPYDSIHVQCSSQFFDDLVAHVEVRAALKNFEAGAMSLLQRSARRSIDFAGVTWEEYRGKVGNTKYVADDKAHAFPIGVPGLFLTRYAPAEFWDTVNTQGLPRYARQYADASFPDSRRNLHVQAQVVHFCTRPRTLFPLKRGA